MMKLSQYSRRKARGIDKEKPRKREETKDGKVKEKISGTGKTDGTSSRAPSEASSSQNQERTRDRRGLDWKKHCNSARRWRARQRQRAAQIELALLASPASKMQNYK